MQKFRTLQLHKNVFRLEIPFSRNKNWEFWCLLQSDQHFDNPKSDWVLMKKHLDEAKRRHAAIIGCGDFFCAMQGKFDKRADKSSVRLEHQTEDYLDALIRSGAEFLAPYADYLVLLAVGNHESAIQNRHEVNLIDRLIGAICVQSKAKVFNGGFSGWLIFSFTEPTRRANKIILHYDHGFGGGGAVTADMIQHQRRAVYLPDADIIISGHTHDSWHREFARIRLDSKSGTLRQDIQTHLKLPTYKDEYADGFGGWAVAKGLPPKPLGAYWLRFYFDGKDGAYYEIIKAS